MRVKITKRLIESIEDNEEEIILRDTQIPGFHIKCAPSGKKVYYLYYRTISGRERRPAIGVHGIVNCEWARTEALNWLTEIANGGDHSRDRKRTRADITFKEFIKKYIEEHAHPNKKPSSVISDLSLIRKHLEPKFGSLKVAEISRADVYELRNKLSKTPGAANKCLALLSKMFNLAEKWGIRIDGTNPVRHVEKYKGRKIERYLSSKELIRLGEVLENSERLQLEYETVVPAIRLLMVTGCRLGEILSLKWQEVDLPNKCLRLSDSKTGPKTVHLPSVAIEVLKNLVPIIDNPYVIYGRFGHGHLVGLPRAWYRIRAKAGIDDVRIHDLRHTFASIGVSAGLSLPIIGRLLGHTQTQTTARYAHLYDDPLKEAVELVGEKISNSVKPR